MKEPSRFFWAYFSARFFPYRIFDEIRYSEHYRVADRVNDPSTLKSFESILGCLPTQKCSELNRSLITFPTNGVKRKIFKIKARSKKMQIAGSLSQSKKPYILYHPKNLINEKFPTLMEPLDARKKSVFTIEFINQFGKKNRCEVQNIHHIGLHWRQNVCLDFPAGWIDFNY